MNHSPVTPVSSASRASRNWVLAATSETATPPSMMTAM